MKEHGLLCTPSVALALHEGRQTQDRRPIKESWQMLPFDNPSYVRDALAKCPVQVGDIFYVRETWAEVHPVQVLDGRDNRPGRAGIPGPPPVSYRVIYRADGEYPRIHFGPSEYPYRTVCEGKDCVKDHIHPEESWHGWRPSIHMQRWASRTRKKVTGIRVEHGPISEVDARAEGFESTCAFEHLWTSIYGYDKLWRWVYELGEVGK